MLKPRNAFYETDQFKAYWFSEKPLSEIAGEIGVSIASVSRAAARRGFPNKYYARTAPARLKYARQAAQQAYADAKDRGDTRDEKRAYTDLREATHKLMWLELA